MIIKFQFAFSYAAAGLVLVDKPFLTGFWIYRRVSRFFSAFGGTESFCRTAVITYAVTDILIASSLLYALVKLQKTSTVRVSMFRYARSQPITIGIPRPHHP